MPAAGAGAVTVIVPVVVVHVGCVVTEAVGAAGAVGAAFTVSCCGRGIQPAAFFTVTL
jgi:hypothetical protein